LAKSHGKDGKSTPNEIAVRWAAPEMLRERAATIKSDVFSFGVCMWEILEDGKGKLFHSISFVLD
jgi:hypothetical protein